MKASHICIQAVRQLQAANKAGKSKQQRTHAESVALKTTAYSLALAWKKDPQKMFEYLKQLADAS